MNRQERLALRTTELYRNDAQFAAARPLPEVSTALAAPGLTIQQVVQTAMTAYADRPALAERVRVLRARPDGTTRQELRPEFTTQTYRQLWSRVGRVATEWVRNEQSPLAPGDLVGLLGFASADYTIADLACIHTGAVSVPLPAAAPIEQVVAILDQTRPVILAVSIEYVDTAVEAVLTGHQPARLVVFDYEPGDDAQHQTFTAACGRLAQGGAATAVDTLDDLLARGGAAPATAPHVADAASDPLVTLIYTSGSTGTPKGVMYTDRMVRAMWLRPAFDPVIGLTYMPMSHQYARGWVARILAHGGICHFAGSSDMSTLFEDFALVRPTSLNLVPRVCDLIFQRYVIDRDDRVAAGADSAAAEKAAMTQLRDTVLGGRALSAISGSAPLAPEMHDFIENCLDLDLNVGYGSTEMMGVTHNNRVTAGEVIDYKLIDVPELGYYRTDRPYPRGELLVKTRTMTPGYYDRPDITAQVFDADGFYRTGDIMAQTGPDQLVYVDRRNNVIKLSQGEFVAITNLEAVFATSPLVHQIYVYGSSARSYLLAVVVPAEAPSGTPNVAPAQLKSEILASLHDIGREAHLNGYEIPREIVIETEPFTMQNGLLTGGGKHARPQLANRYGETLEALYATMAADQVDELRALRAARELPVAEGVRRAVAATLGISAHEVDPSGSFADLGGDSLSAVNLSELLADIFEVEVPVGVLVGAASNLQTIADYIDKRRGAAARPSCRSVHGPNDATVRAADLTLSKFIDPALLDSARALPPFKGPVQTVLLTGATGFLGRFLAVNWLQRLSKTGGRLICIARGEDSVAARKRILDALSTDPDLISMVDEHAGHLEVLAGDVGDESLGMDGPTWDRLAADVDLIVHPAAHVNHMLPYSQLFTANVGGTAELLRLAITTKIKAVNYISSLGVATGYTDPIGEDGDIRIVNPTRNTTEGYAAAYSASKWASEVLTREAHDLCQVPVAVFRPDMILAHRVYRGQLNVPDMFTRLMFSLIVTGIAPASFYRTDSPHSPHYDGLPVDYIAEAVTAIGGMATASGHRTYNIVNLHDDGISLDQFVGWLIEAGAPIERIDDHGEWISRFETALRSLPDRQRQQSVLMVLDAFRWPLPVEPGSAVPADVFRAASNSVLGQDIPHLTRELAEKYLTDLRDLKLG